MNVKNDDRGPVTYSQNSVRCIVLIYKYNRYQDTNWVCQCFISSLFRFINFRFYNNRQLGCDVRYGSLRVCGSNIIYFETANVMY